MYQDMEAPIADRKDYGKTIILTDNGIGTYAHFEGTGETLSAFHGWNSRRKIYFHLTRQGYNSLNIEYGAGF